MKFKNNIQEKFQEAGWYDDRNVLETYSTVKHFNQFPQILKDFLKNYGDLKIERINAFDEKNTGYLIITPEWAEFEDEEDYKDTEEYFGQKLFSFAYLEEAGGYRVCCSNDGAIYTLGDPDIFRSNSFITGIENLLLSYSDEALWFDHDTKEWVPFQ
jgi:hypothetical protein